MEIRLLAAGARLGTTEGRRKAGTTFFIAFVFVIEVPAPTAREPLSFRIVAGTSLGASVKSCLTSVTDETKDLLFDAQLHCVPVAPVEEGKDTVGKRKKVTILTETPLLSTPLSIFVMTTDKRFM